MIQIRTLAIWNAHGECRTIDFQLGGLNVITGEAKTGKSALLEIVDFCLGRKHVSLPEGALTRTVTWYGLLLAVPGGSAFVGRPGPKESQASVSGAFLALGGPDLQLPDYADLVTNTSSDGITDYLTGVVGIGEYEHTPPQWATRPPLRPTIRHASLFSFQRQSEIANPRQLFHRQEEDFIPQAIKDTLPYFLGATDRDAPTMRDLLYSKRRELRRVSARLAEARRAKEQAPTQARALASEAADVGLIPSASASAEEAEALLREAVVATEEPPLAASAETDEYLRLTDAARRITEKLRLTTERLSLFRSSSEDRVGYKEELDEQIARLESIEVLPVDGDDGSSCPVCGATTGHADASVDELQNAVRTIRDELGSVEAVVPAQTAAITELDAHATKLREELRQIQSTLVQLGRDRDTVDKLRGDLAAGAFVRGRISQFLEGSGGSEGAPTSNLEEDVARLETEITGLEERLNPEAEANEVTSRLNVIGEDMTRWADRLRLEHSGGVRIELSALTVVVDTRQGLVPLDRMGSASNWIGYHLISHLALHRWFVQEERPTPRFLMLDQPTQAFYPPEVVDAASEELEDDDRESVDAMFALMRDVVAELAPEFQIIVVDHANLADEWFQAAIVEEWRGGNKLVPTEWLT